MVRPGKIVTIDIKGDVVWVMPTDRGVHSLGGQLKPIKMPRDIFPKHIREDMTVDYTEIDEGMYRVDWVDTQI
jgi:hypothetical protein